MSSSASTAAAKRGRPSDSSTPGGEEPDQDISPKNKRSRVIFIDPTESPLVSFVFSLWAREEIEMARFCYQLLASPDKAPFSKFIDSLPIYAVTLTFH